MTFVRRLSLVLSLIAILALPGIALADHYGITVTPGTVSPNTTYSVGACGLRAGHDYVVDTNGPNFYYTRNNYTATAKGCVSYSDVSGTDAGWYGITLQEPRGGGNLFVIGSTTFLVQ